MLNVKLGSQSFKVLINLVYIDKDFNTLVLLFSLLSKMLSWKHILHNCSLVCEPAAAQCVYLFYNNHPFCCCCSPFYILTLVPTNTQGNSKYTVICEPQVYFVYMFLLTLLCVFSLCLDFHVTCVGAPACPSVWSRTLAKDKNDSVAATIRLKSYNDVF